ncbi:hypothetical protein ACSBR1_025902 [Camellia fascicularis]
MSQEIRDIAYWFVLYNCPEREKEHKNLLQTRAAHDIAHIQQQEFPKWFKEMINRLRVEESSEVTDELWSLANGPNLLVKEQFHTRDLDNRRASQNSGVLTQGDHEGKLHDFYAHLCKVLELDYICDKKVVLFQCEWYNTEASDGELLDPSENNDVFLQENITDVVAIDIDPIFRYCRDDVEFNVISAVGSLDEIMEENRDDEEDEEHNIPDVDMDPDMDYDI